MGALVSSPPAASFPTEARVAVAVPGSAGGATDAGAGGGSGDMTRTTRWASLRVHGTAASFVWILPVRAGALVDLASDAWLESLEDATAPRVVPPDATPPCGVAPGVEVEGDTAHAATTAPDSVVVAPNGATLVMVLAMWGFVLPTDVASAVDAAVAGGNDLVALRFTPETSSASDVRTRTVRITEEAPPALAWSLAGLALSGGSASSVDVTAYGIGAARMAWGGPTAGPPLVVDASAVLWLGAGGSTYPAVRRALLQGHPGDWLEETAGHGVLFGSTAVPGGAPVPATVGGYFARAGAYGDATDDAATCSAGVAAVAASTATVSAACASGRLAMVAPVSGCQETVGSGEIAPDVLRCGGIADDLALALSGLSPANAVLTRVQTVIPAGVLGQDAPMQPVAPADRGPVVTAAGYSPACPDGGEPGNPGGGGGGGVTLAPWAGAGSSNVGATTTDPGDPGDPGITDPGLGDDNSGTDSSGDSSSDSCSSDPAPKDSSNDPSSSSEGCSCGDNTGSGSSDSGGGDSCGSGTSSGGEAAGGGCGSGSGSSNCSTSGSRSRRRTPVSRLMLSLALLAAIARRRGSRRDERSLR
jgi:hypothetical protein